MSESKLISSEKERQDEEVAKNYTYFKENRLALREQSGGKRIVLLKNQKVEGYFDSMDDAILFARRLFPKDDRYFSVQDLDSQLVRLGFQGCAVN